MPGLALHWRFEETTGTTALDSSGSGFNGTYTGDTGTPTPSTSLPPVRYTNTRSRDFVLANRQAVRLPNFPAGAETDQQLDHQPSGTGRRRRRWTATAPRWSPEATRTSCASAGRNSKSPR